MKEMLHEVRYLKSSEDMILALTGQFKQLSHEVCCNQLKIFICCPFTFFAYQCRIRLKMVEYETRTSQALKGHKMHHNLSTKTRYLLRLQNQNIQATIKELCRPVL